MKFTTQNNKKFFHQFTVMDENASLWQQEYITFCYDR